MACGSFSNLTCGAIESCDIGYPQKPYDYAVYTPFVELKLRGEYFTVGNKGANNQSIIESFEMTCMGGKDGGFSGSIVILTCDFKDVLKLLGAVPKSLCFYDDSYLGTVDGYMKIGWIFNSCNGAGPVRIDNGTINQKIVMETDEDEEELSPYIYGLFTNVTYAYEEGYYKVSLEFKAVDTAMELDRNEVIEGSDDQKQECWPSIQSMMQRRCDDSLANLDVMKLRLSPDGKTLSEWDFKKSDGGKKGPKGVWTASQLNNLDGARGVTLSFTTDKNKGMHFSFPNQTKRPSFIVLEDTSPNICESEKRRCPTRTYVVNAGDCTNVLKFAPTFSAVSLNQVDSEENDYDAKLQAGRGGGGPGPLSQAPERINTCEIFLESTTGVLENTITNSSNGRQVSLPANSQDLSFRPASQVGSKLSSGVSTNISSSDPIDMIGDISATLEIIGDPFYSTTFNILQNEIIQIIVITPFCVKKNGHCEFLNDSKCDDKLSGFYKILSAKHSIQKGNYTTTLNLTKLKLDDIDFE